MFVTRCRLTPRDQCSLSLHLGTISVLITNGIRWMQEREAMSRFGRSARILVASALILSTATLFAASPANAANNGGAGSMVDNNDGTMTLTWSAVPTDPTQTSGVWLWFLAADSTCGVDPSLFWFMKNQNNISNNLVASPLLISEGTLAMDGTSPSNAAAPITAGTYTACLYVDALFGLDPVTQTFQMTFGDAAPTTTTTVAGSGSDSNGTDAGGSTGSGDSVSPAFTG